MVQDPETISCTAYAAAVKLATQRMELYREDAETAKKITKQDKSGRGKRKAEAGMHACTPVFVNSCCMHACPHARSSTSENGSLFCDVTVAIK